MENNLPVSAPAAVGLAGAVRPFRFGIVAASARNAGEWVDKAQRAESLGYATLVMPDNLQYTLAPLPALATIAAATGSIDQMCETLVQRRERLGFSYVLVSDELMEPFAPVVERLAGH